MDNEIWKMYPEFDFIQGSTIGRVRTLDRVVVSGRGTRVEKGRVLKQQLDKYGYLFVCFNVNGKQINRKVHRLVAETFISNPDNLPEINHKDNNPLNNNISNLEWCSRQYNIAYREKYGTPAKGSWGRQLFAVNLKTTEVLRFPSQSEASRELSVNCGNLNSVLKGRYKQTGGYWFTNADENAVETVRTKFGDSMADRVENLMNELQPA